MSEPDVSLIAQMEALRQELRRTQERVDVTEDALSAIEDGFAGVAASVDDPAQSDQTDQVEDDGDEEGPDPASMTPNLEVLVPWVQANVSHWCERRAATKVESSRGIKWCSRWFDHPEAVSRLWVTRAAQIEAASAGAVAVSLYLRDHFDHHLSVLTDANGPFSRCSLTEHLTSVPGGRFLPTQHPSEDQQ